MLSMFFDHNVHFQNVSTDPMSFYAQVRSTQLDRSMKGFKAHFRKGSVSSGSYMYLSPAMQSKHMDSPTKKTKTTGQRGHSTLMHITYTIRIV